MPIRKYRLVTRADFDGVVSGSLLMDRDMVEDVIFAEPAEMQQGRVAISDNDVTANLPYVEGVHLCFDHHHSESLRVGQHDNLVIDASAPSAARVIYDYYGGEDNFPLVSTEMMEAVDKADSGRYTEEDILAPEPWVLLNFITDPRTGFKRFDTFKISNDQMMKDLMIYCRRHPVEELLKIPDVEERLHLYWEHEETAEMQIRRQARIHGNLIATDMRDEDIVYLTNRFMVYGLFPECNISLNISREGDKTVFAVGKSILNRSSKTNVGALMLEYGGGGHAVVGTCRVPHDRAEEVQEELIQRITADG